MPSGFPKVPFTTVASSFAYAKEDATVNKFNTADVVLDYTM